MHEVFLPIYVILLSLHSVCPLTLPSTSILKSLKHFNVDETLANTIITTADLALTTYTTTATCFLSPLECYAIQQAFKELIDVQVKFDGGYPQAERQVALFSRNEEYLTESQVDITGHLTALSICGNFLFEKPSMDEFLETIKTCGPVFSNTLIGDVILLPGDKGAQVVVDKACGLAVKLKTALKQVRGVAVTVEEIPVASLYHRPASVKEMTLVEASTRLDAVASGALGLSRTRMVKLIESGAVSVSHKPVMNGASAVMAGQEVLVRGFGRLSLSEVSLTSKGKYRIRLTRYS